MNKTVSSGTNGYGAILRASLVYMIFGFLMFVILGILGLFMRAQQSGILYLGDDWFYRIMTLHGIGMISSALLIVFGGFAAVLGRSLSISVKWLWVIFLSFFLGMGFVLLSTLIGGFAAAWTVLYPLPFQGTWSLWAAIGATAGLALVTIGMLLYFVMVITETSNKYGGIENSLALNYLISRGKGNSTRIPNPYEILGVAVSIPGLVAVAASFIWLIPVWLQASGLILGTDVLFMKNMDYLFGHLIANLTIYFAAGLLYFLIPIYTKRELKTTWSITLALNSAIVLLLVAFFHHLYQDFAQPMSLSIFGEIATYISTIPVVLVTIFSGLSHIYRAGIRWSATLILIALGLWGWVFGGIGGLLDATIAINQVMHNTLWVPGHFHTYLLLGTLAFAWAFLYHLVHHLSGIRESPKSKIAAILYGIGAAGFVLIFFLSGAMSIPRRFSSYLIEWQPYAVSAIPFIITIGIGILWLGYELFKRVNSAWAKTRTYSELADSD